MTGNKAFVVLEIDGDGDVVAVWGPFDYEGDAESWGGLPSKAPNNSYSVMPLYDAPDWQTEWNMADSEEK